VTVLQLLLRETEWRLSNGNTNSGVNKVLFNESTGSLVVGALLSQLIMDVVEVLIDFERVVVCIVNVNSYLHFLILNGFFLLLHYNLPCTSIEVRVVV